MWQNYFIIWATVLANEYNVISSIFVFWSDKVPIWGYFLIFWSAFMAFQLLGVEAFGEAEFWLAWTKLLGLSAYFIFAIIYASGGLVGQDHALGFRYWHNPGPWNGDGFRGVATVFVRFVDSSLAITAHIWNEVLIDSRCSVRHSMLESSLSQ